MANPTNETNIRKERKRETMLEWQMYKINKRNGSVEKDLWIKSKLL